MSDTFNFSLRMPEDLGNTIYDLSKEDRRPMNTMLVMLLESAVKEKVRKRKKPITRFQRKGSKNTGQEPAMSE